MRLSSDPPQPPLTPPALLYEASEDTATQLGSLASRLQAQNFRIGGILPRQGGYGAVLSCRDDVAWRWWEDMTRWSRLYRLVPQRAGT